MGIGTTNDVESDERAGTSFSIRFPASRCLYIRSWPRQSQVLNRVTAACKAARF